MGIQQDLIAALGEFVGTTLFLLMAFGGAKSALLSVSTSETTGVPTVLDNQTQIYIALSFGLSLLVNAWVFYRITGGLFNPAITLALFLCGGLSVFRAALLTVSQILAGIAAAALLAALTPFGGAEMVETKLGTNVNVAQGLFIEAFLTSALVLTVLFLAVEKYKGTYLAPIGIGLTILACHLFGVVWTGCGINPARSFGPSVVSGNFPGYHWIYWLGPILGCLVSVGFYKVLLLFDYTSVAFAQDASQEEAQRLERQEKAGQSEKAADEEKATGQGQNQNQNQGQESQRNDSASQSSLNQARGRVIMVHSKKDHSEMFGQNSYDSYKNNETMIENGNANNNYNNNIDRSGHQIPESVVIDLDAVTFYECDTDAGHRN